MAPASMSHLHLVQGKESIRFANDEMCQPGAVSGAVIISLFETDGCEWLKKWL